MANIISFESRSPKATIDIAAAAQSKRLATVSNILPAEKEVEFKVVKEQAADPIKDVETIDRISQYLIQKKRYRDNMLFVVGINFGLRVSDLLQLRFCHLIDDEFHFRDSFPILEKKTEHTRSEKRNRHITINDAVIDAVLLFLEHNPRRLDEYLFCSESNRNKGGLPMDKVSVNRILRGIKAELNLPGHYSSHTLRKTFGYHQMAMSNNDPRKLFILQKIFGHSSSAITLEYIGLTNDEIEASYMNLNLAGKNCYGRFNKITETATA